MLTAYVIGVCLLSCRNSRIQVIALRPSSALPPTVLSLYIPSKTSWQNSIGIHTTWCRSGRMSSSDMANKFLVVQWPVEENLVFEWVSASVFLKLQWSQEVGHGNTIPLLVGHHSLVPVRQAARASWVTSWWVAVKIDGYRYCNVVEKLIVPESLRRWFSTS